MNSFHTNCFTWRDAVSGGMLPVPVWCTVLWGTTGTNERSIRSQSAELVRDAAPSRVPGRGWSPAGWRFGCMVCFLQMGCCKWHCICYTRLSSSTISSQLTWVLSEKAALWMTGCSFPRFGTKRVVLSQVLALELSNMTNARKATMSWSWFMEEYFPWWTLSICGPWSE